MTAEIGLAALWLAAAMALLQLVLAVAGIRLPTGRGTAMVAAVRPLAIVGGSLSAVAFLCLILVFLTSDMSVTLVAENSHSAKPWLDKLADAWANHAGAMLLWVTMLGLAGAAIAVLEKRVDERTLAATLGAQAAIALGFFAFLVASNPFARADPAPIDGAGLKSLLQDPGLAFHPTTLVVSIGLAVVGLAPYWGRDWRRTPLGRWGVAIMSLGAVVTLFGVASDATLTKERRVAARPGQTVTVGPFRVVFDGIKPVIGANWSALEGRLSITRGDGATFVLRPQQRYFANPPTTASEAAIATRIDGQLYAVLGAPEAGGRWQLRLWWKPFVTLIWFGGILIALGGALSLLGRWWRERRPVERERYA